MSDDAVIFWNKEPPTSPGWYWHTFTVAPDDYAVVEVVEEDGRLFVSSKRGEGYTHVLDYGGKYSRWWPMQVLPPAWPENNP